MKQYFIPSYEEAVEICEAYDNFQFYETIKYIDGYKVCSFNYRFVSYNDFNNPIKSKFDIKAFELRGLCFIFNLDGSIFKRYILMDKFFNLNENELTNYDDIKDKKIIKVEDKLDGSIITFISLPNGKVYAKSKMVMDSEQAIAAHKIYENNANIKQFVDICLKKDIVPIFEYVSPLNRIVLKYNESELILLKMRLNSSGRYINDEIAYLFNIKRPEVLSYKTWDEILPLKDSLVDKEGFVITLEDNLMLKYKCNFYNDRHFLRTEIIPRENFLIEKVIKEEIDDIVSSVDIDDFETLELIDVIRDKVSKYIKESLILIDLNLKLLKEDFGLNIKNYVLNFNGDERIMHYTISIVKKNINPLNLLKEQLLKHTSTLQKARIFLNTGKI